MFNGIIYNQGIIKRVINSRKEKIIEIKSNIKFNKKDIGSSICCNGACLTLTSIKKNLARFYLSPETLFRTNFKFIKVGDKINMEKSLRYGQEISGYFVQGHIDTCGQINNVKKFNKSWFLNISVNRKYFSYLIEKASITINGVSLTISKVFKNNFEINIIPHTLKLTNLKNLKRKDNVNIEFDIISKYLKKIKN